MKKNLIILAVIAFIFSALSANAQTDKNIENAELTTEFKIKKELPESTPNIKKEIKETDKEKDTSIDKKRICPDTKKECTKKEKKKCAKQQKSKTTYNSKVRKCSANLSSCCKKKAIN